jgi:hypothetical protein
VYALARPRAIYVFANGSSTPSSKLTAFYPPGKLATDDAGDLFAIPAFGKHVEEFMFTRHGPVSRVLDVGTNFPAGIAVEANGNLVVGKIASNPHGGGGNVSVYAPPYTNGPLYERFFDPTLYALALNRATGEIWVGSQCLCLEHGGKQHIFRLSRTLGLEEVLTPADQDSTDAMAVDSDN